MDIHLADDLAGQAGLAGDGIHNINRHDAHFFTDIDM